MIHNVSIHNSTTTFLQSVIEYFITFFLACLNIAVVTIQVGIQYSYGFVEIIIVQLQSHTECQFILFQIKK